LLTVPQFDGRLNARFAEEWTIFFWWNGVQELMEVLLSSKNGWEGRSELREYLQISKGRGNNLIFDSLRPEAVNIFYWLVSFEYLQEYIIQGVEVFGNSSFSRKWINSQAIWWGEKIFFNLQSWAESLVLCCVTLSWQFTWIYLTFFGFSLCKRCLTLSGFSFNDQHLFCYNNIFQVDRNQGKNCSL
jgi:hypothetical protein